MKRLIESTRYITLLAVAASLLASVAVFVWGVIKTAQTILKLVRDINTGDEAALTISFIELMDTFLVAAVLYIFAVAVYELFIGDLDMPAWLIIRNLDDLKSKLSSVIVLFIVIIFLENLVTSEDATGTLLRGTAAAVIILALVAFNRFGSQVDKSADADDSQLPDTK